MELLKGTQSIAGGPGGSGGGAPDCLSSSCEQVTHHQYQVHRKEMHGGTWNF
jgi:hypothetical protein